MNVSYANLINDHTLNIFTDASILQKEYNDIGMSVSSPGAQIYLGDQLKDTIIQVLPDCTNNEGEITAIQLGLYLAVRWRAMLPQVDNINLFSDSKISLLGLRDWSFSWVKQEKQGIIYGSGGPVKNQLHFIDAIHYIIANDLRINLYHVRGHMKAINFTNVVKFRNTFRKENHLSYIPDDHIVNFLIKGNNSIDDATRKQLNFAKIYLPEGVVARQDSYTPLFNWHELIMSLDMNKYAYLIGGFKD